MTRSIRLAVGATALVVGGMACAEDAVQPGPGQLAVVADATAAAGAARMETTFVSVLPEAEYRMSMEGVIDFARDALHVTMSSDLPGSESMSGEIIVVDGMAYLRGDLAQEGQQQPREGVWVRHEHTASTAFDPFTGGQPTTMVDALRELGLPIEVLGRERVRDVATTRYRVDATAADLIRAQQDDAGPDPPPGSPDLTGMPTVIDVWVDDQDRLRRLRTETDMTNAYAAMGEEADGGVRTVMELELYDYGVAVDIAAPPEDQVVDYDPVVPEEQLFELDDAGPPSSTSARTPSSRSRRPGSRPSSPSILQPRSWAAARPPAGATRWSSGSGRSAARRSTTSPVPMRRCSRSMAGRSSPAAAALRRRRTVRRAGRSLSASPVTAGRAP